jgi:hypothetical protein
VKAGGRKYNPNQVHEVERIVSEHSKLEGHRRFGIKWAGWDATYNTIEPETSVLDKSLIQDWDALRRVEVDLEEAKASQRATFASDLLKLKEATYCFEVSLPACSLGGVAHALLARDAERYGVELEVDDDSDEPARRWTSIQLDSMEQIGEDLQLELIDPKKFFGAICARKGRLVQKEIWVAGPPYVKTCAACPRRALVPTACSRRRLLAAGTRSRCRALTARLCQESGSSPSSATSGRSTGFSGG